MSNEQIKHIEIIQSVVTRCNTNSFQIKGWCITVVSALLALYASTDTISMISIAILPILFFWFLDSFYLQTERRYTGLYNDVISNDVNVPLFNMSIEKYEDGKYSYWDTFMSGTIWGFYVPLLFIILVLLIIKASV